MQIKFVKVECINCHISLYSQATSENSSNKKITNIPLHFLETIIHLDKTKAETEFIYFLRSLLVLDITFFYVTVPTQIPVRRPYVGR